LKILVRMPTRLRPTQALEVLAKYRNMAGRPVMLEVVIDDDDASMTTTAVRQRLAELDCVVTSGPHKTKVEAVNGGVVTGWDVIVLASDDMCPVIQGWALHVEHDMHAHFPMLDGALFYNDGHTAERLCTLPIQGKRLYAQFPGIYNSAYRSLWVDNEQTEVLRGMGRLAYIPTCIIEHRHPANAAKAPNDELYEINNAAWDRDRAVYNGRKARNFDVPTMRLSILIATMPKRDASLQRLLEHIWAQALKRPREVEVIIDAGEGSTGAKRQSLLGKSRGEFVAFIDDDDWIAGDYVDRILAAIAAVPTADCVEFHVEMRQRGEVSVGHCSIRYAGWATTNRVYTRCPNHLSPVRRVHALRAGFPDKTIGEDYDYSMRLRPYLKTEAPTAATPFYFYVPGAGV
jgi:hypothetical protein